MVFISKTLLRAVTALSVAILPVAPALAQDANRAVEGSEAAATVSFAAAAAKLKEAKPDQNFEQLFNAWERSDGPQTATASLAIPSRKPVEAMTLTSEFGTRADPFSGRRKSHQGIDIPGAIGTPIYATADGIVGKSQWFGGYGNFVSIQHGNTIETRYGHMSRLNVEAGQRVAKGQVIGFMGSTGRSTGSHLHYEVRIGGEAVNPMAFVMPGDMILASFEKASAEPMGGPEDE